VSAAAVEVEVEVLVAGETRMPPAYVFRPSGPRVAALPGVLRPRGRTLRAPLLAYVVRHPGAGTLLIDTGLHPGAATDLRGDYGRLMGTMFRSLEPAEPDFAAQLRARGVEPGEVELVVMTHLHVDHTGGMRLLPRARFACDRAEWAEARGRGAPLKGYAAGHLPAAERMRLLDLRADGVAHGPFRRTLDLFGDGSVRLVSTPGHTPGHLSVLLRLAGGRELLVVADAAYTLRSIEAQALPFFTADDEAYRRSLAELKAYADTHPEATLVPTHDADAWRAVAGSAPVASAAP